MNRGWRKMPRFKHWERRIGHLLLCVDTDKNWNVQNRDDDDAVTDARCSLAKGNEGTIEASKAACMEAARVILRDMLKWLPSAACTSTGPIPRVAHALTILVHPTSDATLRCLVCGDTSVDFETSSTIRTSDDAPQGPEHGRVVFLGLHRRCSPGTLEPR